MRRKITEKGKNMRYSRLSKRTKEELEFYLFILPWLIGFVLFWGGPIIGSFVISLTKWPILSSPQWVGFSNYVKLFKNPIFYKILINTAYYSFSTVTLGVLGSLIAALLLNQKLPGVKVFRLCYYLPSVIAGVPLVLVFIWLYDPTYGLINSFLLRLGIVGPRWLWDVRWAMPALILMNLWKIGGNMIIFLAALQGLPQSIYEAARVDGANWWQQFIHLTVFMISPIIFLVVISSTIVSFQVFTEPYIMTEGGPANATLTYVLYIYRSGFEWGKMGYASAAAWILLIIILGLTAVHFKFARHWVYYEGE